MSRSKAHFELIRLVGLKVRAHFLLVFVPWKLRGSHSPLPVYARNRCHLSICRFNLKTVHFLGPKRAGFKNVHFRVCCVLGYALAPLKGEQRAPENSLAKDPLFRRRQRGARQVPTCQIAVFACGLGRERPPCLTV